MARRDTYNQESTTLVVDSILGTGLGEDGVTVDYPDALSSLTQGVNDAVTSFSANKTATVTVNVFSTSPLNDFFYELYSSARSGAAREFPMTIYSGVDEKIDCTGCSISQMGSISTGQSEQQSRTYTINVRYISQEV